MLVSDWFSFPGLATGSDWFPFPGLNSKVLNVKSGDPDLGSDWLAGGGVRSGNLQRLFPQNSKMESFFFFFGKLEWLRLFTVSTNPGPPWLLHLQCMAFPWLLRCQHPGDIREASREAPASESLLLA